MLKYIHSMDQGYIFSQVVSLTGSFNLWLVLAIFLITLSAEFGFSIPYLLESMWLLVGYSVSTQALTPASVAVFCIVGLVGRETGAGMLYRVSGLGNTPVLKLYNKLIRINSSHANSNNPAIKHILLPFIKILEKLTTPKLKDITDAGSKDRAFFNKISCSSPLTVALGRFTWLKLPITITMGMSRRPLILLLGVAIFSLVWDCIYILIGVLGSGSNISPSSLLIYTVSGFISFQIIILIVRRILKSRRIACTRP